MGKWPWMWRNPHASGKSLASWTGHVTKWSRVVLGLLSPKVVCVCLPGVMKVGMRIRAQFDSGTWNHHCSCASIYSQRYHSSDLTTLLTIIWCHCQPIWRAHEQFWFKHRVLALWGQVAHPFASQTNRLGSSNLPVDLGHTTDHLIDWGTAGCPR